MTEELTLSTDSTNTVIEQEPVSEFRCHAAAIYLRQGERNEKFDGHPRSTELLPLYCLLHNPVFELIELCVAIFLLTLAFFEHPAAVIKWPIWVHACLETFCLFAMLVPIFLKLHFFGWRTFSRQKRSVLKLIVIVFTVTETFVVLGRNQVHPFRFSRALRPFLLVDNRYCYGIRRFSRQILQSLPPTCDVLLVLVSVILLFSISGHTLFSSCDQTHFGTIGRSFVSLFVLLTSANYPDVMMKSYHANVYAPFFFATYISISMYFIMNLLLAAVYESFATNERLKFDKLRAHRLEASKRAFALMSVGGLLAVDAYTAMYHYLRPRSDMKTIYLSFKALNVSDSGRLTQSEFSHIYTVLDCDWGPVKKDVVRWFDGLCVAPGLRVIRFFLANDVVRSIGPLLSVTLVILSVISKLSPFFDAHLFIMQMVVTAVQSLELLLKFLTFGPKRFFTSKWAMFATILVTLSFVGVLVEGKAGRFLREALLLRSLELFKSAALFRKTYRFVFQAVTILMPRLISASFVLILLFYAYGVIGIELFHNYNMRNCCNGTSVETDYLVTGQRYYYLNNFRNIYRTYVTLFELLVVNNWYIHMEAYAFVAGQWARIYFMTFYLVTMVVLTIVVAFTVETFLFRIQCDRSGRGGLSSHAQTKVKASELEVSMLCDKGRMIDEESMKIVQNQIAHEEPQMLYEGVRKKNRFDFSSDIYFTEASDAPEQPRRRSLH